MRHVHPPDDLRRRRQAERLRRERNLEVEGCPHLHAFGVLASPAGGVEGAAAARGVARGSNPPCARGVCACGDVRRSSRLAVGPLASYRQGIDYRSVITIEPGKRGGKPCVRGLRITGYDVLEYLAAGMSQEEIVRDFPELTAEDIRACLSFAADRERRLLLDPAA